MKYKLLKDLPLAEAGTEVEFFPYSNDEGAINMILESEFHKKHIADINKKDIPEWLEEVKEPKTIYDLKYEDTYFAINYPNKIVKYISEPGSFGVDCHTYCFLTEREAKRNKLLRELATRTDKWLPEKLEHYIDIDGSFLNWHKNCIIKYHQGLVFRNEEEYNKYITEENKKLLFEI